MKKIFPILLFLLVVAGSCAKVSAPVGGPRDTTPPKIVKEQPNNQSVNFNDNKIHVTFNEFFTLNNPIENILVSPPFKYQPEYEINGKTLVIKLKDTLQNNTTYNIVFSNCIKDYNEGNPLNLYHYSFSTGSFIDSCVLKGTVTDARTHELCDDYCVMLYRGNHDTLPLTTLPDYITKTLKNGTFVFRNIADGDYKIFALKDINSNYLYDLPNEAIAFSNLRMRAYPEIRKDSAENTNHEETAVPEILLKSFIVQDSVPKLLRYENPEAGIYRFPYSKSINSFEASPITQGADYFQTISTNRDTIIWYLKNPTFDSLRYCFIADGQTDTVFLKPFTQKTNTNRRLSGKNHAEKLRVTFRNEGDCYNPLTLHFSYPILPSDTFNAWLISKSDTIIIPIAVPDTFLMDLPIPLSLETKKSYRFIIPDSAFTGYNQLSHDTLQSSFTYKSEKEYGNIIVNYNVDTIDYAIIVQLKSDKKIIQENILTGDTTINYAHLTPGNYNLYFIHDENGNGRWDTGDYNRKRQPEYTESYEKPITVRAFWDIEETIRIDRRR